MCGDVSLDFIWLAGSFSSPNYDNDNIYSNYISTHSVQYAYMHEQINACIHTLLHTPASVLKHGHNEDPCISMTIMLIIVVFLSSITLCLVHDVPVVSIRSSWKLVRSTMISGGRKWSNSPQMATDNDSSQFISSSIVHIRPDNTILTQKICIHIEVYSQ